MKYNIIIIAVLFILSVKGQPTKLDEKNGFKDYKLSSSISNYPNLKKYDFNKPLILKGEYFVCDECYKLDANYKPVISKSFSLYYCKPTDVTAFGFNVDEIDIMTIDQKIVRIQLKIKVCDGWTGETCINQCEFKRKSLVETIASEFGVFDAPYYGTSIWKGNKVWLNVSCSSGHDLQNESKGDFQYIYLTFHSLALSEEIKKVAEAENTAKKDY